jgi:hypothetical protein
MKREQKLKRRAKKQFTYLTKIKGNMLRFVKPVYDVQTKRHITGSQQPPANMLA